MQSEEHDESYFNAVRARIRQEYLKKRADRKPSRRIYRTAGPEQKIARVLQKRVHARLKHLTNRKTGSTEMLLGYSYEELRQHLEKLFTPGMTWSDLARGEIHIDHVVPLSRLCLTDVTHPLFKRAWGLENLQPLWAKDNQRKSNKLPKELPHWYTEHFGSAAGQ